MQWTCKFCRFSTGNQRTLIRHYKLKHGHYGPSCPLPCIHIDCPCTFKTQVALKRHLVAQHERQLDSAPVNAQLLCELCDFCEPFDVTKYFVHFGKHVKSTETVNCPFKQCSFKSNVFNTFKAHKSRYHHAPSLDDIRPDLIHFGIEDHAVVDYEHVEAGIELCTNDDDDLDHQEDGIEDSIKHSLASLFLRMQAVLHISKSAIQEIVDDLYEINRIAQDYSIRSIRRTIQQHNCNPDVSILTQVFDIVQRASPLNFLYKEGQLGTTHKRSKFYKDNFTVIEPVEYVLDTTRKRTFTYVPILHLLTELLNRNEVLDQVLQESSCSSETSQYSSFYDGSYRKENHLLSGEEFHIAVGLYIDDFEICNPLGTSRKKHKICGIYWVIANLPLKYRSSLSSIYLATLCYSSDIKTFGYDRILEPLLKDIEVLENQGLYVQKLGASVTGTLLYVSSDNLGAHSLAGFQESFSAGKVCRFCLADRENIQDYEVKSGKFPLRTQESLDNCLSELQQNERLTIVDGVKQGCALNKLSYFQTARGFPPDLLHDIFEGIVPV